MTDDDLVVKTHVARDLLQNAALFKTDKLVVWEYVVNGLQYVDQGTIPRVVVSLDSKKRRIAIADNGRGMSFAGSKGLANYFVMHGENVDFKEGRIGRGRFGTGKSAAFGIGDRLTITTVHLGKRSKVALERSQIEEVSSGEEIPIQTIEREVPTNEANGTLVEIDGVRLKSLDQSGIIKYIERHLAHWPKKAVVIVNNHECEYQEPPVAWERTFSPEGQVAETLGDVTLVVKVSKSALEKDLQGVSVYANGVWHETTLAGNEGREMAQYIFGDIDVPGLDQDDSPTPPFDLSRSMRLNPENRMVQAIYAFVGKKVDDVRRELAEKEKKRRAGEEAKKLAEQASQIAEVINEDFNEFRKKLQKVKAQAKGGIDKYEDDATESEDVEFILGGVDPGVEVGPGGPGHGDGQGGGSGEPPPLGSKFEPSPEGDQLIKPNPVAEGRKKARGGFDVRFRDAGLEAPRANYVRDERTIYINLEHPQIAAAKGLGSQDEAAFRRLAYEVAFSEYAIALASEMAAQDEYLDPSDPIVDIRETLNRVARKSASLYQ